MTDGKPRTAEPSDEFDAYELVILRRPADVPLNDDATAELFQRQQLGHFATMKEAGFPKVVGPLENQSDESWRGVCLHPVGSLAEARRIGSGSACRAILSSARMNSLAATNVRRRVSGRVPRATSYGSWVWV